MIKVVISVSDYKIAQPLKKMQKQIMKQNETEWKNGMISTTISNKIR